MVKIFNLFFFIVATLCTSVHAFSKATGSCAAGKTAIISEPHTTATKITTGSLATGGYTVKIGTTTLSTASTATFSVGVSTTITISGAKAFTGFFARLGEVGGVQTDTAFTATSTAVQIPKLCTAAGVGGICQTSASKKTTVSAGLKLTAAATAMPLDVIIVVLGNDNVSEYYYSQFKVSSVAAKVPTKKPTKKPTLRPTIKK